MGKEEKAPLRHLDLGTTPDHARLQEFQRHIFPNDPGDFSPDLLAGYRMDKALLTKKHITRYGAGHRVLKGFLNFVEQFEHQATTLKETDMYLL